MVFLALVGLLATGLASARPAAGFGSLNGQLGQRAEHEGITRAALACPPGWSSDGSCFEPRSLAQLAGNQLAGQKGAFGAVAAPDIGEFFNAAAHCDDADFIPGFYPKSAQARARTQLLNCVRHLRVRFHQGVTSAQAVVNKQGMIVGKEVNLRRDCVFTPSLPGRAKCNAIEGLGRALHGAQDFYSHSNWTDQADSRRPIGLSNPPGLNRHGPSPILDLLGPSLPVIPKTLFTGCYTLRDRTPGVGPCKGRVTHDTLNKDRGLINSRTGATSDPRTARGRVRANFAKAVAGAIAETRRQWRDMRSAILANNKGTERGWTIICSLTHDNPLNDCQPTYLAGTLTSKNTIDCSFPTGTSHEEINQKAEGLKLRHPAGAPDWVWDITAGSLETKVAGNSEGNDNPPRRVTWSAQGTQAIKAGQVQGDFPFRFEPGEDDGTWAWTMEGHVVGSDSNGGSYDGFRDASAPLFDAQGNGPPLHISVSYGDDGVAVGFNYSGSVTGDQCTTEGSFMGQLMQVPPPSGPAVATR